MVVIYIYKEYRKNMASFDIRKTCSMLIARLGRDSLDTDSQIEEFVRDDQGKERTKRIIPADLERVLKQSAHFWKSD